MRSGRPEREWAWGALGAFGAAAIIGAATLVAYTLSQGEHARLEENRAFAIARGVAYVAGREPPAQTNRYLVELYSALEGRLLEAYFLGTGSVDRFGLSTGNTYQANLNGDLVGQDPRQSGDVRQRDIFNRSNAVLGAVTTGSAEAGPGGSLYIERLRAAPEEPLPRSAPYFLSYGEVGPAGVAGRNVNVPVVAPDGTLVGAAGVTVLDLYEPPGLPWGLLLGGGLVLAAAFFALGVMRSRWPFVPWAMLAGMVALMVGVALFLGVWERSAYDAHVGAIGAEADRWLVNAANRTDAAAVDYALRDYRDGRAPDLGQPPFEAAADRPGGTGTAMAITLLLLGVLLGVGHGFLVRTFRFIAKSPWAYVYVVPSMVGMMVLVFGPFLFGVALAFHERDAGRIVFVGLDNFIRIFSGEQQRDVILGVGGVSFQVWEFAWTLGVTVLWTASNVIIHVVSGLILALILNDPLLKFKKIYRVLLILPWAIPNYITALIWRAMFDTDNGAVNEFLGVFGIERINWLSGSFLSAFTANLLTNCWLGFPFMMVISLGALQSIPHDLYEAADVDGATRWQKFKTITLPLLKPALFPAVILGSIWTFNMFNIIYLVSGGGPANNTEILITNAFKAFYNLGEWGYAAAYSVIIFVILVTYSSVMNRVSKGTEGAFD